MTLMNRCFRKVIQVLYAGREVFFQPTMFWIWHNDYICTLARLIYLRKSEVKVERDSAVYFKMSIYTSLKFSHSLWTPILYHYNYDQHSHCQWKRTCA